MNEDLLEREKRASAELGAVILARSWIVRRIVQEKFPEYPVGVNGGSDIWSLCVYVLNVPDEARERVQQFILDLGDDKDIVGGFLVLPMVKSVEVTKQYYPQFADKKGDGTCLPPA